MSRLGRTAGLTGFLEVSRELGLDALGLAAEVGLPNTAFTDPDLLVSAESLARIYELAAERSGAEDFALRVAEGQRISNLGIVGLVVREQPTVRKALQALARYHWLQNDGYSIDLHESDDHAILRVNGTTWEGRQSSDLAAAATIRTLKGVLGEGWRPLEVWLTHAAPAKLDAYRRVLGVTPRFDQDILAIILRREDLDVAIPAADPALARQVTQMLDSMTADRSVALSERVRELIVTLLPAGACSVDEVARRLGMDRRTLHRRLRVEAATFSGLLDETRRDIALSLLGSSDRPLQAIAHVLGFSGLSAFAHWFRRQFGQSASAWRAARAEGSARASARGQTHAP